MKKATRAVLCLLFALMFVMAAVPAFAAGQTTRFETVSFPVKSDKAANMKIIGDYIDDAGANNVDLILFPELSTCGLPEGISMNTVDDSAHAYFKENAELVPEGPTTQTMMAYAKKYNMYIAWTMLERDPYYPDKIYNTEVLVGPEGFVGKYHKVHRAGTESYMEEAGTVGSDVFDTSLGKIGLVICFDKTFPDTVRDLKIKGADIVLAPSSWPGLDKRLGDIDPSLMLYRYSGKSRNVENGVVFLETNWSAEPGATMNAEAGHARIADATGKSYGETGWEEGKVVADIDVQGSIDQYYKNLGMTREEHVASLKKDQERHEQINDAAGIAETNVKFYGSAILNTLFDTGNVLKYGVLKAK